MDDKLFDIDYICGECLVKPNCNEKCKEYTEDFKEAYKEFKAIKSRAIINHVLTNQSCPLCNHDICSVNIQWPDRTEGERWNITLDSMCNKCNVVLSLDLYIIQYNDYIDLTHYYDHAPGTYDTMSYKELCTLYSIFNITSDILYLNDEFTKEFISGYNSNGNNIAHTYEDED